MRSFAARPVASLQLVSGCAGTVVRSFKSLRHYAPEDAMAAAEAGGLTVGIILAARSKRCVVLSEAKRLAKAIRDNAQRFQLPVAICAVIDAAELSQIPTILQTFAPERIQIHGTLSAEALENLVHSHPNTAFVPVIGVSIQCRRADETDAHLLRAVRSLLDAGAANVLLDAANASGSGGTGTTFDHTVLEGLQTDPQVLAQILLAGGLSPVNAAEAAFTGAAGLISIPALKRRRALNQPKKFIRPLPLSAAFLRRSLTTDCESSSIQNSHLQRTVHHEAQPYFGRFGGQFVPEILIPALDQLEEAFIAAKDDPTFQQELHTLLTDYAGRPTPLTKCRNLTQGTKTTIYLKREDLVHGGAHKTNQVLGQALLARRMGKTRIIAETGAGQHGVATAIACALLGFKCRVYMGAKDVERQKPNVFRMD